MACLAEILERKGDAVVCIPADGTVHEWQRYADERTRERDEARRQLGELANDAAGPRAKNGRGRSHGGRRTGRPPRGPP